MLMACGMGRVSSCCASRRVYATRLPTCAALLESLPDEVASPWPEDDEVEENDEDEDDDIESGDDVQPGEELTEEGLSSQEILIARWKKLIVDASIRSDDLAAKCIPLVARGTTKDCLYLNYSGRPTHHTVSHTPRCLRISVRDRLACV